MLKFERFRDFDYNSKDEAMEDCMQQVNSFIKEYNISEPSIKSMQLDESIEGFDKYNITITLIYWEGPGQDTYELCN